MFLRFSWSIFRTLFHKELQSVCSVLCTTLQTPWQRLVAVIFLTMTGAIKHHKGLKMQLFLLEGMRATRQFEFKLFLVLYKSKKLHKKFKYTTKSRH